MIAQKDTPKQGESESDVSPFEWLTSADSLESILCQSLLFKDDEHKPRKALHLGCGSSALGEYLVQELRYQKVVNVDVDDKVLDQMESRWKSMSNNDTESMEFIHINLTSGTIPFPSGYFDLVVDKSTLDCTLCSEDASTGLLCEAYRSLNAEDGGVYVVISFNHTDLLFPLLKDLSGAEWTVEHKVIPRQVEDLISNTTGSNIGVHVPPSKKQIDIVVPPEDSAAPSWTNGSFEPDDHYRRYVNVFFCRRHGSSKVVELDRDAVHAHIHKTNDEWFQTKNPMLTKVRRNELQNSFEKSSKGSNLIELKLCYDLLFSDEEREYVTYEYFLEDWQAFLEEHPDVATDEMTFETAIKFLQVMQ